jgi:YesN/AraC family two-component response regulator
MSQVPAKPWQIVIADDTPDIRMLLRWSIEADERFRIVGEAANGAEALSLISAHPVDAILLDLAMPVMDGLQAIPQIKLASPSTKIVVLSGFDEESMAGEALSRGADAYLEKGIAVNEITDTLSALCSNGSR